MASTGAAVTTLAKRDALVSDRVSQTVDSHVQASSEGNTTVRILALCAGLGLLACSLSIPLAHSYFGFLEFTVLLVSLVVGMLAVILESNLSVVQPARSVIVDHVSPLGQMVGRGYMYASVGVLECCIISQLNIFVGVFTAIVGMYMIRVGQRAVQSLATLKEAITDERKLIEAFQLNDRNGDGALETFEFDGLLLTLGIELDNDELEAAFCSIDRNGDKKIAYDEFRTWWKSFTVVASNRV